MAHTIQARVTAQEFAIIKARASLYAGGNMSFWVVDRAIYSDGEYLINKDGRKIKRL